MTAFAEFSNDPTFNSVSFITTRDQLTAIFENYQLYRGNPAGSLFYYDSGGLNIGFGYNITGQITKNDDNTFDSTSARAELLAAGLAFSDTQWTAIVQAAEIPKSQYANATAAQLKTLAAPLNTNLVSIAAADILLNPSDPVDTTGINQAQAYLLMNNFYTQHIDPDAANTFEFYNINLDPSYTDSITSVGLADEFYNTDRGLTPIAAFGSAAATDFKNGEIGNVAFETAFLTNSAGSAGIEARRLAEAFVQMGGEITLGVGAHGSLVITSVNFSHADIGDLLDFATDTATNPGIVTAGLYSADNIASYNLAFGQLKAYLTTQGYYVPQTATDVPTSSFYTLAILNRINAVFSDSNFGVGGLIHTPNNLLPISINTTTHALPVLPAGQAYVFDATSGRLYTTGASLDGHDSNALIIDTATASAFPRFDTGTYSSIAYNSSTGAISVGLENGNGETLGTLAFTPSADSGVVTTPDGLTFSVATLPAVHVTAPTTSGETDSQILAGYLSQLSGTTITGSQLDALNFNFLNPAGTAYSPTGTAVDQGGGVAEVIYEPGTPGAVISGASTVVVGGVTETAYNVLATVFGGFGDIARDTINNVQELETTVNNRSLTLTHAEFTGFSLITEGGSITAADGGTFDLTSANVDQGATWSSLTATDWSGTTLIGNAASHQTLTASLFGNDTLTAGNGTGDTLVAGGGVDTITGGTGGDTFVVGGTLAAGSALQGNGTGNTLQIIAGSDLSGSTISGIQTLSDTTTTVTLDNAEVSGFTAITTGANGTMLLADGGTYNLHGKATTGADFVFTALSNAGTTIIGSDSANQFLHASLLGTDTIQAGNGNNDELVSGGGGDTLIGGTGTGTEFFLGEENANFSAGYGVSTPVGNIVTFNGTTEQIVFASTVSGNPSTTVEIQGGTQATVIASGGNMTVVNGVGGVEKNTTTWNAGGSLVQTYTQLIGGGTQEQDVASTGSNGTGTVTYQQTIITGTGSPVSDALSGHGNISSLSNAAITLADNASATLTGSGDTVGAGASDTLAIQGSASDAVTVSGNGTTATDDAASFGNSYTLNGNTDGVTLAGAGDTVTVIGTSDTVNITGTGDTLGGGSVTFNGGQEEIAFGNSTVFAASGVTTTITASDGVMTVENGVGGVTQTTIDWTAGGSQVELYSNLPSGAVNDFEDYSGADGTGSHIIGAINFADGSSKVHYYTGLASGVSSDERTYSGAFGGGTLEFDTTDYTAGGSQIISYISLPPGALYDVEQYGGPDGTGTHLLGDINFADGSSQVHYYTGLGSGVSAEYRTYSSAWGAGTLESDTTDFTSGGSQVVDYTDLPTGALYDVEQYAGPDGTGTHVIGDINFADGSSQVTYYTGLSSGVSEDIRTYSSAWGQGTLESDTTDFTAGGSQVIDYTALPLGALEDVEQYGGPGGTGTHVIGDINFADGSSQVHYFTGLGNGVSVDIRTYSQAWGQGTLESDTTDFTAGGSQVVQYTNLPTGISSEVSEYAGPDGTGTLLYTSLVGTSGNDTLTATGTSQALVGNGGSDTYQFGSGDGADTIVNGLSTNSGPTGTLELGADKGHLWFEQVGNNLQIDLLGSQDHVTVAGWYSNTTSQLQEITSSDGYNVDAQLQLLVQAMATFGANNSGFNPTTATQMPTDTSLQSALAAAWHS